MSATFPCFPPAARSRQPGLRAILALGWVACAALAGCSSLDTASQRMAGVVQPYKPQVVQGNFVSREQVDALRPGVTRDQVRDILGTPLVASVFHADRWDYTFTLRRQGVAPQAYRLSVFFKEDRLERLEGDTLPTEAEFADVLDTRRPVKSPPVLEATEAQLSRFAAPRREAASAPAAGVSVPGRYPPLEPAPEAAPAPARAR